MSEALFAVLYTDGGCMQSKGVGGWGVHGYVFDANVPKVGTGLKGWRVTPRGYTPDKEKLTPSRRHELWADFKELAENTKVENVNVVTYVDDAGALLHNATNNVAELTAMLKALNWLNGKGIHKALLMTDSRYVCDGLNDWIHKWISNGWTKVDGEPVANHELWRELVAARQRLEDQGMEVQIEWIRGHAGNHEGFDEDNWGNALADEYATKASIAAEKQIEIANGLVESEARGYWKPKVEVNRLLAHSRWYFDTFKSKRVLSSDGRYIYHLGDHGKDDDFLGKRMSDASFAVVYLKEPEPVLEALHAYQVEEDAGNNNSLVIGRLDFIFKPAVYQSLAQSGGAFLKRRSHKLDLYTHDKLQLTKELKPPRLAFNLIEVMEVMETLLNNVLGNELAPNMRVTDITESLYDFEAKGRKSVCKLKPEMTSAVKSLSVHVEHPIKAETTECPLTLTIGMDTPHRNALSAIADKHPRVKVVTWLESKQAFRYATVVEADGDAGIFAGFYSNIHLVTK